MVRECCVEFGCSCPDDPDDLGYYSRNEPEDCCVCLVDKFGCEHEKTGGKEGYKPHRKGPCGCYCDPDRLDCEGATPDTDLDKCECYCHLIRFNTKNGVFDDPCAKYKPPGHQFFNPNTCDCECVENYDCKSYDPANPDWDPRLCLCLCKTKASDCKGATPDWDPETCSCICKKAKDAENGLNPCPDSKLPDFNQAECKCECNGDISDCTTKARPNFNYTLCECDCHLARVDEEGKNTCDKLARGPNEKPGSYTLDAENCDCKCNITCAGKKRKARGFNGDEECWCVCDEAKYKDSCADDEKWVGGDTCDCVPDYQQSILNKSFYP